MLSNPGGDNGTSDSDLRARWISVLAHRSPESPGFDETIARFARCGLEPREVNEVLADGGDALYAAAASGVTAWADAFGGPLAVALLAAEFSVFAAHLNSRASSVRSVAVEHLLEDFSAVTVATELGISRQKVYEVARNGMRRPYIDTVPWRTA